MIILDGADAGFFKSGGVDMLRIEGKKLAVMDHLGSHILLIQSVNGLLEGSLGGSPAQKNQLGLTGWIDFRRTYFLADSLAFLHTFAHHLIAVRAALGDVAFLGMFIRISTTIKKQGGQNGNDQRYF